MSKLRDALTYANVVSTLALFVALGGASYAALRLDDFAEDEIPEGEPGLDGFDGRDGLDGEPGPPGPEAKPEWWAVVAADGTLARGTAMTAARTADGAYTVDFGGDRRGCGFLASLDAGAGSVAATSGPSETADVLVTTFDEQGAAADRGFHLSARC